MPPYKRRYVKKRYPRSRSASASRRRPTLLKRLRTRAYANLRTGGLLAIERKFSDWAFPATALGTGGAGVASGNPSNYAPAQVSPTIYRSAIGVVTSGLTPTALNVIGTGDSGSDRDGRQVINDSIHIRGAVYFSPSDLGATAADAVINIVLVLDTQTNGAGPTGGQVFVNPGDIAGASPADNGAHPFVNLSNSKRFRILKHIRRGFSPPSVSGNGTITRPQGNFLFAMDVPLKQMKTNYVNDLPIINAGSGAASVASIGDNGLFLFAWTDNTVVFLSYNSRLRFRG